MVIIPAFALGRTQDVLYHLSALADAGRLDPPTVFLDSPMAIDATEIYDRAEAEHDEDSCAGRSATIRSAPTASSACRTVDQSKALNTRSEPAVIVASSGMANGGRVVHHLLHRLGDRAELGRASSATRRAGTRGRALVDGAETVAIHGQTVRVRGADPPAPGPLGPRRPGRAAALVPGPARAARSGSS